MGIFLLLDTKYFSAMAKLVMVYKAFLNNYPGVAGHLDKIYLL